MAKPGPVPGVVEGNSKMLSYFQGHPMRNAGLLLFGLPTALALAVLAAVLLRGAFLSCPGHGVL
jgi:hypothetical protein